MAMDPRFGEGWHLGLFGGVGLVWRRYLTWNWIAGTKFSGLRLYGVTVGEWHIGCAKREPHPTEARHD